MIKILLAEDDFIMVSLLKTLFGMEGFEVATLLDKTGDVLENIRSEMPDVMLLDYYLGSSSGIDLLKKIRKIPDLKNIKIVMTSGIDKTDECLKAGADDFVLKPYMPDDLIARLRQQVVD
ncbi:MAG: response regulator [Chloroflexota bacterium]